MDRCQAGLVWQSPRNLGGQKTRFPEQAVYLGGLQLSHPYIRWRVTKEDASTCTHKHMHIPHIYPHIFKHTHTHVRQLSTHVYTCTHKYMNMPHIYTNMHTHAHATHLPTHTQTCIHMHMPDNYLQIPLMYMPHIYPHMHIHAHTNTNHTCTHTYTHAHTCILNRTAACNYYSHWTPTEDKKNLKK